MLITGSGGAIGGKLIKRFPEAVGVDTKNGQNLLTCQLPEKVDVIYHLAAHPSVENSWKEPVKTMENFTTTVRLATLYPESKIIFASTWESLHPESPYGFSKFCANEYLKKFHPNSVILYFPNIWGTGRSVVDLFKGKSEVTIYGDGTQMRDYVHLDDIIEGLVLAKEWSPGEYQLGSGKSTSLLELAKGKKINFMPALNEAKNSFLGNTTPDWKARINVLDYEKL